MSSSHIIQYTLRNIPKQLDQYLRRTARANAQSLNEVALEALIRGAGLHEEQTMYHDLDALAHSWKNDPEFDLVLEMQDQIDSDLWK